VPWHCATEIYIRWHETKCRERTCSKYTKVVMRLWNAELKYVKALSLTLHAARTHITKEYRIMVFVRDGVKFHLLFAVATAEREALAQTHTLQLQSTFSYFTLFAVRARDILLCTAALSLSLSVCVPRFAARVITACRNKLANTNINRESWERE
jgi:hypothetical protein